MIARAAVLVAVLVPAATASADPATTARRSAAERLAAPTLHAPVRLALEASDAVTAGAPRPAWLRLPELPPEELELAVPLRRHLAFTLAADLTAELPRLDAVDGETHFSAGLRLDLGPRAALFVEDFLPASAVVGGAEDRDEEPVPRRSWDGHQVSVGVHVGATPRVAVRAAVTAYVLSESRRSSGLGGELELACRF